MKKSITAISVCTFVAVCLYAFADLEPADLEDSIVTDTYSYEVYYTNDPTNNADFFSDAQAQDMADALDPFIDRITGLGFRMPSFSADPEEVHIFDSGNIGTAPNNRITMDSPSLRGRNEPSLRLVLDHEHFHHTQYAYINFNDWPSWGQWTVEGTARLMQDKLWDDLDANGGFITFWSEVQDYMNNADTRLPDLSYKSALFWQYLCEHIGSVQQEPQQGVDVIRRFWEETDGQSPDSIAALKRTISTLAPGRTLDGLFHDFGITNYTKDLDLSDIQNPDRFRYRDDDDVPYASVSLDRDQNILPPIGPVNHNVQDYANRYYVVHPVESVFGKVVGFRSEGDRAAYAVFAVRDDKVLSLHKGVGTEFSRVYYVSDAEPIDDIVAVVTGLESAANYSYKFTAGDVKLSIVEPTFTRLAFVGAMDDPRTFLIRLRVTGPEEIGGSTVWGLRAEDFTVRVGEEEAEIRNGDYVQGEFWLAAQAPVQEDGGPLYNLEVQLGDITTSQTQAVMYADILKKQALVIDASGSMLSPEDFPKINAAKSAALLYTDAAGENDQMAVVSFGGDDNEPNEDATTLMNLSEVGPNRAEMRNKIRAINIPSRNVMTSIGDGLNNAQDELDTLQDANYQPFIVLLSDGKENEARFWADNPAVRNRIVNSGAHVITIALGPDADQALMQSIANETGGYYYYVDLNTPSPPAKVDRPSRDSAVVSQFNDYLGLDYSVRLADVYKSSHELVNEHGRLWEESGALQAGNTKEYLINVNEDGFHQAVLAIYWSNPDANMDPKLIRPNGSLVQFGDPGVQIRRQDTHVVYQLGDMAKGKWTLNLTSTEDTDFISMLSGLSGAGLEMQVRFTPNQRTPELRDLDPNGIILFLRGLPIPIQATLVDQKGPVRGADVVARVLAPDGKIDTVPLFDDGAHEDGNANDGIYGNVYRRTTMASQTGQSDTSKEPGLNGSYMVQVTANGVDSSEQRFQRFQKTGFQVFEFLERDDKTLDPDQDGMPTRWENLYGLDPNQDDAARDLDSDGLKNIEEYQRGVIPTDPDTDHGGESDLSEINNERNNYDHRDDIIPRPIDCGVIDFVIDIPVHEPVPNTNLIYFPWSAAYNEIQLFRGESRDNLSLYQTLTREDAPNGVFKDENVVNGRTYYYQIIGIGSSDEQSAPSRIFTGTPKADPLPPKGWIKINNGVGLTDSNFVKLDFDAYSDIKEMRVSHTPAFKDAEWQPSRKTLAEYEIKIQENLPFATVYVQFRDAAMNVSNTYSDQVELAFEGDPDDDGVINKNDQDNDNDGLSDNYELFHTLTNHFLADSDGDGINDGKEDLDGDGLININERENNTDPNNPDSDNDGFTDQEEVSRNSDPNDPDNVPVIEPTPTPTPQPGMRPKVNFKGNMFEFHDFKFEQKSVILPQTISMFGGNGNPIDAEYMLGYGDTSGSGKGLITLDNGFLITSAMRGMESSTPMLVLISPEGKITPLATISNPTLTVNGDEWNTDFINVLGLSFDGEKQLNVLFNFSLSEPKTFSSLQCVVRTIIEGPLNSAEIANMFKY